MSKTLDEAMKARAERTSDLVTQFNKRYKGGTVYLKLNNDKQDFYATFTIKFHFDDPFVDKYAYRDGGAYIYPSDALYMVLDVLAGNDKIAWNNTHTTGWLSFPTEAK